MTNQNIEQLANEVSEKKRYLSRRVMTPMTDIALSCLNVLQDAEHLDAYLTQAIQQLPNCSRIYVTDRSYRQISSNISVAEVDKHFRGQDLDGRPYLQATIPLKGLVLSDIYEDERSGAACISLVQAIQKKGDLKGLVIADFRLDDLPIPDNVMRMMSNWQQFRGDPAIRNSLFSQQRQDSYLDSHIKDVHRVIVELMQHHGVFHFKLHYSSSRVTLWFYDQPHHYRIHMVDQLLSGAVQSRYPRQAYPEDATVSIDQLQQVQDHFVALRYADDNIYLRSGSVNIVNGMVGLNFSCDGTHYMSVDEFIDNDLEYWLGGLQIA